ncbi:hypothetical protein RhiXN_10272 [Rhizoctonia solani]|uniref:Uncharacterized protein n=1 Tax=Rhizoctonia solani TaxID=456999 RepID=A0A8H8P509_9AGAM|nr:uncharacterized protein RhiXN_10272 [Rhizoctonia solani]QRW23948.1 hypothetical protein RhiXN_10272 [Rhizoctonia solani]
MSVVGTEPVPPPNRKWFTIDVLQVIAAENIASESWEFDECASAGAHVTEHGLELRCDDPTAANQDTDDSRLNTQEAMQKAMQTGLEGLAKQAESIEQGKPPSMLAHPKIQQSHLSSTKSTNTNKKKIFVQIIKDNPNPISKPKQARNYPIKTKCADNHTVRFVFCFLHGAPEEMKKRLSPLEISRNIKGIFNERMDPDKCRVLETKWTTVVVQIPKHNAATPAQRASNHWVYLITCISSSVS